MKKLVVATCLLILSSSLAFAQNAKPDSYCGYTGMSDWLIEYQKNPEAYPQRKTGAITYLPMTVHILGDDEGDGYFGEKQIIDAFCTLNEDLLPYDIQFYLADDFNYIDNTSWYIHDFRNGRSMMNANNVDGTTNTYFVEDPAGNCGYYTGGADAMAVAKGCAGPEDHTWSHEVGHYLSLPHPFVGWEGIDVDPTQPAPSSNGNRSVERVDGSNCRTSADGFCDTTPDYISNRWSCNQNGTSAEMIDPSGTPFRADGSLIMSYANDACASRFSDEQAAAMHANINDERPDLINNPTPPGAIDLAGGGAAIYPQNEETIPFGTVEFQWEPIPNATQYLVEITFLSPNNDNIVMSRGLVNEAKYVVDDFAPIFIGRPLNWRVRPFNEFEFCAGTTDFYQFSMSNASSVSTISEVEEVSVSPVPAQSGNQIIVGLIANETFDMQASLINLTGQVLRTQNYNMISGSQQVLFDLPVVAEGVYMLSLKNDKGERIVKRVVIN